MAVLDEGVISSVINSNFKSLAELVATNAVGHQHRLQIIAETALTKSIEAIHGTSVAEGLGISAAQRGDLAKQLTDLGAAVAAIQQQMKGAQTTPPPTTGT